MKTLKEYIAGITTEFDDDPYLDSSEEAVDWIELPGERKAQVTIKIQTDKGAWLPLARSHNRSAITR